jgi:hypothetical protein
MSPDPSVARRYAVYCSHHASLALGTACSSIGTGAVMLDQGSNSSDCQSHSSNEPLDKDLASSRRADASENWEDALDWSRNFVLGELSERKETLPADFTSDCDLDGKIYNAHQL